MSSDNGKNMEELEKANEEGKDGVSKDNNDKPEPKEADPDAKIPDRIEEEHCRKLFEYYLDEERPGLKTLFYKEISGDQITAACKMANDLLDPKNGFDCKSREAALYLSLLTLYDLIIFVDDSISMVSEEGGERKKALTRTLLNIAKVYQLAREKGICCIRFINYLHRKVDITSKKVKPMLEKHKFEGLTKLGTELKVKVLDELLKNKMEKPVLVITITDGDVDGELKTVLINVLSDFIGEIQTKLKEEKAAHTIGFQFARVGTDKGAKNLLNMLEHDELIGDYIDCLPMSVDEMKNNKWIVLPKLLLGGISRYWNDQSTNYEDGNLFTKKYKELSNNNEGVKNEEVTEEGDDNDLD